MLSCILAQAQEYAVPDYKNMYRIGNFSPFGNKLQMTGELCTKQGKDSWLFQIRTIRHFISAILDYTLLAVIFFCQKPQTHLRLLTYFLQLTETSTVSQLAQLFFTGGEVVMIFHYLFQCCSRSCSSICSCADQCLEQHQSHIGIDYLNLYFFVLYYTWLSNMFLETIHY